MTVNRLDLLFTRDSSEFLISHPDCVITGGPIDEFVFTDCNGGVQHATKINNFARLTFHERFPECLNERKVDPERFQEVFPNETLPEDSLEGFHFFDREALRRWIVDEQKRTCPICVRRMDELLVCPYLTEKFNERREELLQEAPVIEKLTGEHVVNVEPSSVLQDRQCMASLFLVEMALFAKNGEDPLVSDFVPETGLIAWCLERDEEDAKSILDAIRREKAMTHVNIRVLKQNPLADVIKKIIDAYLESLGTGQDGESIRGAQMQLFMQCFFGDNTNWTLYNSLMTHGNLTLTYELADVVMVPPDKRRLILPRMNHDEVKAEAKQKLKFRGLVGLVVASVTLFYLFRSIYRYFKAPDSTIKT